MHEIFSLVPFDDLSGTLRAENRIRRMIRVPLRVIAKGSNRLILIRARRESIEAEAQSARAMGIFPKISGISAHEGYGGSAHDQRHISVILLQSDAFPVTLQVIHRPAHSGGGQFQPDAVPGLQELAFCLHQPLA
ncbi:hypothetical protein SDC9_165282 [bioreactor metagenome]|uniref:Uncharacterized protein n=1 Tax=bioreactor metagenome TaxID=1076179 RepID=A0A645FTY2_9ZZZZ